MAKDSISFGSDSLPRQLALLWAVAPSGIQGGPGNLGDILGAFTALVIYGTPEELKAKYEIVRATAIVNHDLPMDDQDRSRIASSLNELGGYIRRLSLRMKQAEEVLRKAGWRYRNGKASRIAKRKGRDLFSECVWMVYEKYREKGNTFAVRRKIAKELSCFFDHPSDLDPGDGEPICNAIRNRLKRGG